MKRDPIKWGTHLPLLVRMFDKTEGDVLEMGTGNYSTPILIWLCEMSGRTLYSYESRASWYEKAKRQPSPFHKVIFCDNWATADIERHWGLAFIDHSPGRERHTDIKRLANLADIIVIHDTEPESEKFFRYRSKVFPLFKYRFDFTKYRPWTSAVSNFIDVSKIG